MCLQCNVNWLMICTIYKGDDDDGVDDNDDATY